MAWSTREIAELAGTSLRTVRHYHEVGLLDEPERLSNGYKQYGVAHLVRLLRIKRLTELGFSLTQIAEVGDEAGHPEHALRALDAELAATIERLQRARMELGLILNRSAVPDLPSEFAGGATLTEADRSFLVVLTRILGPRGKEAYAELLSQLPDDPAGSDFDNLPEGADEATRQELAERMVGYVKGMWERIPGLRDLYGDAPDGAKRSATTAAAAMRELYNPAQLDVVKRLDTLLGREPRVP